MLLFPLAAWIAIVTSGVVLAVLWASGEVAWRHGSVALAWLLVAGYCQFVAGSTAVRPIGLVLQTLLAIYLLVRWKLSV